MTPTHDAIILGAGAAGMFCAGVAGQRGRRVLLIDHVAEPGAKIVISGGGRCNFTNTGTAPDRFLSANPHFAKSALGRYTAQDFLGLVERYGIAWHEKTKTAAVCGYSGQITTWALDADKPKFTRTIKNPGYCVAFTLDGKSVITGHDNGTVAVTPLGK